MEIIDHGHGILEYQDAIKRPEQVIDNINELDQDPSFYEVLPKFGDWMEGYPDENGVWRPVNIKGRNKVFRWTETNFREDILAIRERSAEKVIDPIWFALKKCVHMYADHIKVPIPKIITRNIDLRVYATGEELGLHTDTNHGGPFTHYSLVVYLNDDYEGGEIYFPEQNVKVKPKAGTIVAFPATTLHTSLPVTKGEKWHSPCFWYGDQSLVTSGKEAPNPERFL